jgi:two-component system NtrC family sensor kinase
MTSNAIHDRYDLEQNQQQVIRELKQQLEAVHAQSLVYAQDLAKIFAQQKKKSAQLALTEQQLIRSEKLAMMGRLAAGIAHEMNNALTPILGFTSLLLRKQDQLDEDSLSMLQKIAVSAEKISEMLGNILDFSRKKQEEKGRLEINYVIDNTLSILEHKFVRARVEVVRNYSYPSPRLVANEGQLEQVFMNLFLNACDAMPNGGTLTVETKTAVDQQGAIEYIETAVTDTGKGVQPEDMERIFEPFFSTKKRGEGIGLGLFVSYGIIEQHGGHIDVSSEVGKGSTFIVRLPPEELSSNDQKWGSKGGSKNPGPSSIRPPS